LCLKKYRSVSAFSFKVLKVNFLSFCCLDIELGDVVDVKNPIDKVVAGLQTDGDKQIPLKAVHIRAKLQDLTSEVYK